MSRTSGQSHVQTTLETFQDLDLCSKTVIMDVVGYIEMQQLRENEHCDLNLTSFSGTQFLLYFKMCTFYFAPFFHFCYL